MLQKIKDVWKRAKKEDRHLLVVVWTLAVIDAIVTVFGLSKGFKEGNEITLLFFSFFGANIGIIFALIAAIVITYYLFYVAISWGGIFYKSFRPLLYLRIFFQSVAIGYWTSLLW